MPHHPIYSLFIFLFFLFRRILYLLSSLGRRLGLKWLYESIVSAPSNHRTLRSGKLTPPNINGSQYKKKHSKSVSLVEFD